jgi:hypothetical protein
MAKFILKDQRGNEQEYDHDKIFVMGTDGELVQFTEGEGDTPAVLQDKTITENGTYTADSGYDGLGSVTVEVAGSGGGSLPAGIYWRNDFDNVKLPNSYEQTFVVYNGYLYSIGFTTTTSSSKNILAFRKYNGSSWTEMSRVTLDGTLNWLYIDPMVYNGKIHLVGAYSRTNHVVYDDENGAVKLNAVPDTPSDIGRRNTFVDDGKLKYFAGTGRTVYSWDESTDTWTSEVTLENGCTFFDCNGEAYYQRSKKIYKYHNGVSTEFGTTAVDFIIDREVVGEFVYTMANSSFGNTIYRIDLQTGEEVFLGRAPGGTSDTNYYNLVYYDGKLRLMGANGTKQESIAMYEVTE